MARNEEKAQSMLNRWWAFKSGDLDKKERKRPYLASKCNNTIACEKWRLQILHEIGQKVQEIQSAALGEHKLRQLNDEINKLIREKGHWERRILELGGPNYLSSSAVAGDDGGQTVEPGGYRYFGAARDLPGVKQLFFQQLPEAEKKKKTRADLYRAVDADYYGFRDDEDGKLEELERAAEAAAVEAAVKEWEQATGKRRKLEDEEDNDEELSGANVFRVPSAEAVERALIERRKQDLLRKYSGAK
ncbi:uncharacterized protein ACA1_191540 [Acanthamoeba castellanii str. Neff]|uniref:Uncharacterized protein n=1 Tax=Acanthamoeba castellanii (strain ATCC 30010 / Neff) TaxID=1257118 RepID=L8GQP7_ACACF|nr:uncharacterized protein ACA1_191540 [Acanthamoeba castellanii str. Neff]ELR14456.1 hypothetical protein ACA1_191540 [Acanthamoeba castellanii str. Neff]